MPSALRLEAPRSSPRFASYSPDDVDAPSVSDLGETGGLRAGHHGPAALGDP
jgi:hypothetical protein